MTTVQRSAAGEDAGWQWTLLLPPNWVTLPVEPATGRAAVKRLLDRELGQLPRDRVAMVRRQLETDLRGLLAQARDAGATALHTHVGLVRGLPVTATCTVRLVPGGVGDPALVAELAAVLGADGSVVELDVRPLAGLPGIRRRRRRPVPVEGTGRSTWSTGLDWVVALPDGDGAVLLSFSTVTEPVADELVQLFDAMAGSLTLEPREA